MPRNRRLEVAGGVFHVTARGVDRRRIFMDEFDHELYLSLLGGVSRRQGWFCLAYCLMPNHVHVLVETPERNLGDGIRRLHGTFAQTFNERHARSGHLFERRFGNRRLIDQTAIAAVASYIAVNPVAGGLVAEPEDWRWSSHAAVASRTAPTWLGSERLHVLLERGDRGRVGGGEPAPGKRRSAAGEHGTRRKPRNAATVSDIYTAAVRNRLADLRIAAELPAELPATELPAAA